MRLNTLLPLGQINDRLDSPATVLIKREGAHCQQL